MSAIFQLAFDRFKIVAGIVGDAQGRIIATLFYFTILVPFGLIARFLTDPMRLKDTSVQWLEREPVSNEIDAAKLQG